MDSVIKYKHFFLMTLVAKTERDNEFLFVPFFAPCFLKELLFNTFVILLNFCYHAHGQIDLNKYLGFKIIRYYNPGIGLFSFPFFCLSFCKTFSSSNLQKNSLFSIPKLPDHHCEETQFTHNFEYY